MAARRKVNELMKFADGLEKQVEETRTRAGKLLDNRTMMVAEPTAA